MTKEGLVFYHLQQKQKYIHQFPSAYVVMYPMPYRRISYSAIHHLIKRLYVASSSQQCVNNLKIMHNIYISA